MYTQPAEVKASSFKSVQDEGLARPSRGEEPKKFELGAEAEEWIRRRVETTLKLKDDSPVEPLSAGMFLESVELIAEIDAVMSSSPP